MRENTSIKNKTLNLLFKNKTHVLGQKIELISVFKIFIMALDMTENE